jgi:hypothetical protein
MIEYKEEIVMKQSGGMGIFGLFGFYFAIEFFNGICDLFSGKGPDTLITLFSNVFHVIYCVIAALFITITS